MKNLSNVEMSAIAKEWEAQMEASEQIPSQSKASENPSPALKLKPRPLMVTPSNISAVKPILNPKPVRKVAITK